MSYSGRKRYTSRKEKYERTVKNTKRIAVFVVIAIALLLWMNWRSIYNYLKTFTY